MLGIAVLGCSSPKQDLDLVHIQDDQYAIDNPSKDRAIATGIGCGAFVKDAVANAQDIAQFNLRTLTGAGKYRVEYRVLHSVPPQQGQACVEVEAKAVPLRMR